MKKYKEKEDQKMMFTGNDGVSYYKIGKKYFSNSGWLEREITKEEYEAAIKRIMNELKKEGKKQ